MTILNDGSTDDETSIEEIEVKVEADDVDEEKSDVDVKEEDTSSKNEPSKPMSQDDKRSAGKVIANLGNEKKALAEKLVTLAKTSEDSRQEVKKMLTKDPATANYLKGKFGDDYDSIVGDEPLKEDESVDVEQIKKQAVAQAQAEAIKAQIQVSHEELLTAKGKQFGFTSEEQELFIEKVELLGGDEKAMSDAALIVNHKKATAKGGEFKTDDGGEAPEPKKKQVTITPALNDFADGQHVDKKEFASGIHRVKGMHKKDNFGKPVMELPTMKND